MVEGKAAEQQQICPPAEDDNVEKPIIKSKQQKSFLTNKYGECRYGHFKDLLEKNEKGFTEIEVDQRSSDFVAEAFQRVAGSKRRTFQIEKRDVHQPQYESMVEHIADRLGNAGGVVVVVELGAGKGLFGRLLRERCAEFASTLYVAIDRRHVRVHFDNDDENEDNQEPMEGSGDASHEVDPNLITSATASIRIAADIRSCNLHEILSETLRKAEADGKVDFGQEKARVILVAKHFCASATDAAVDGISEMYQTLQQEDVANQKYYIEQVVVAPCCHPQIILADYSNLDYFKQCGIKDYWDLEALKQLLVLSKCRTALGPRRGGKNHVAYDKTPYDCPHEAYRLGRLARRLIEEGRLRKLQDNLNLPYSSILEYVPSGVTPDNLLLLLHKTPDSENSKVNAVDYRSCHGIHLTMPIHLHARKDTLQYRLTQYLLERARQNRPGWDSIDTITVQWLDQGERPSVLMRCKPGCSVDAVLQDLDDDQLLLQCQVLLFPFTKVTNSLEEAGTYIKESAIERGDVFPTRVQCFPRKDEQRLMPFICMAGECGHPDCCTRLSPTEYVSAVTCVRRRIEGGKDADIEYHVGITSRDKGIDPRKRATAGRIRWDFSRLKISVFEALHRGICKVPKGPVLLVCNQKVRQEVKEYLETFTGPVVCSEPDVDDSGWRQDGDDYGLRFIDEFNGKPMFSFAVVESHGITESNAALLQEVRNLMLPGGVVLIKLNLADAAQSSKRRLHKRQVAVARFLLNIFPSEQRTGAGQVQIEHLLTDKEIGRIAVCELP